jgi:predicted O-methyltransferase YrrM
MKWLLQNVRRRTAFAFRNPRYAVGALVRELTLADEKFIAQITGVSARQIRGYMDEPIATPDFAELLQMAEQRFRGLSIESADLFAKKVLLQYAAARALAPERIVETGIANGVSSAYLLLAIRKNGNGRLHSIELGDPVFLPAGAEPGWLVPAWLRVPWQVHIGDTRRLLPPLLAQLGAIDMFVHDSLHTYDHMLWEYEAAYPALRRGGLLLSDDALWNDAFRDFARKVQEPDSRILRGVGFLVKSKT